MSVNKKIFGLASSVIVFTGMAYGQALNCNAPATPPSTLPTNPIELRSEGVTELVSDTVTTCAANAAAIQGNVTAFISGSGVQGITSKSIGGGLTEATLQILDQAGVIAPVYYSGTVSGSQVTFGTSVTPVTFPTYAFKIQISNVRVNVSGTYPNVPQAVTETVFAGTQGVASLFNPVALTVGYIRNGLQVSGAGTVTYTGAGSATAGTAAGAVGILPFAVQTFPVCTATAAGPAFSVNVAELFAGAIKTQVPTIPNIALGSPANIPGSEQGSLVGPKPVGASGNALPATVGTANFGTRIKFVFGGIPAGVTLTVPNSIVGIGGLTMTLHTGAETATLAPAAAGTTTLPAGATATAIYEATVADLTNIKSFVLPVAVTFTANGVIAPAGPITVTTSYAPSPATPGASVPATIPTIPYFANTGTVLNASAFTVCQTTLLFPFVTNQLGFETGLAIANTGLDNLGAAGASVAKGQAGACTFNFYGSIAGEGGAQPATPAAANFPKVGTIVTGTTHADVMTNVVGGPFQGYAIAVCPFLYAKGYAFIASGLTTPSGVVQGYVADVINANRTSSVAANAAVNSNTPESSGN